MTEQYPDAMRLFPGTKNNPGDPNELAFTIKITHQGMDQTIYVHKNDKKNLQDPNDKKPNYSCFMEINGQKFDANMWAKDGTNGAFLYGKITPPYQPQQQGQLQGRQTPTASQFGAPQPNQPAKGGFNDFNENTGDDIGF